MALGIGHNKHVAADVVDSRSHIPTNRAQDYTQRFFSDKLPILQGVSFPCSAAAFTLLEGVDAPDYWSKALSAFDLDSRNFSYPKED